MPILIFFIVKNPTFSIRNLARKIDSNVVKAGIDIKIYRSVADDRIPKLNHEGRKELVLHQATSL